MLALLPLPFLFMLLSKVRDPDYLTLLLILVTYASLLAIFPNNVLDTLGVVLGDLPLSLLILITTDYNYYDSFEHYQFGCIMHHLHSAKQ